MGAVVSFASYVADSLTNLVSRMGTGRDKATGTIYAEPVLADDQLLNAYRGSWLARKIVDIPAFDSVRAWRDWQAEADQIEKIEAEESRLQVRAKVLDARIKARLWGGSAIHIGVGDQDLSQPLNVERVGTGGVNHLTVLTRRQLTAGEVERDVQSEFYGHPKEYRLSGQGATAAVAIHPSRLVLFHGARQVEVDLLPHHQGWGDSTLLSLVEALKQAEGTAANIASLVFEAKIDIVRVPNFMASLKDEEFKRLLLERFTLAATAKGINGMLILDKEEEYESKAASFDTLPDVLDRFFQLASGAADIPATRLLGQAPAGMNATGESDLRNYYDRLSADQVITMTPAMHRLDECLIRSALGSRDPSIYYTWAPLWGLSEIEKANVLKTKADAARTIVGGNGQQPIIPIEAVSDALVTELIEDGSLSGLEAAIEEYGKLSEQEPDEEDEIEAAGEVVKMRRAANDKSEDARGAPVGDATFRRAKTKGKRRQR